MEKQMRKKGYNLYDDGEYRKKITVSLALTEEEINKYNKMVGQSHHRNLKDALESAMNEKLLALWEDFEEAN